MTPLQQFMADHPRLFVLTGAGCSTDSGIPDYRDRDGQWKRPPPVNYAAFMQEPGTRKRYWARSLVGWRRFGTAVPNATHHALVKLEQRGQVELLVTQNVDRLHQHAGSQRVLDLHGRLDQVRCMGCEARLARNAFQQMLEHSNPEWAQLDASDAPDGDADLEGHDFQHFEVPVCPHCSGTLKPDVVFFGESVPRERVETAGSGCRAGGRLIADGLFRLPFRRCRRARRQADRRRYDGPHACRCAADPEGRCTLWRVTGVSAWTRTVLR
jgi:NAD-dependent SIR2 family protein deacetylase